MGGQGKAGVNLAVDILTSADDVCSNRRDAWLNCIRYYIDGSEEYGVPDIICRIGEKEWRLKGKIRPNFRTMVDSWFAYKNCKIAGMLKRTFAVQWLNRGDLQKEKVKPALQAMHFISHRALLVLNGSASENLVKDHAVPVRILREELKACKLGSIEEIEAYLLDRYRLGIIAKSEDNNFRKAKPKLISRMPSGESHWLARYNHPDVNIKGKLS